MAQAGEVEVFRITPQVGKCYEHIEATRVEYVGKKGDLQSKYYSKNQPAYVGKFLRMETYGERDGSDTYAYFDDNGKKNTVKYSYEGMTCFTEVECKSGGGMRKRSKSTRRKLKTRKNRK
jgi:hypothetical protein